MEEGYPENMSPDDCEYIKMHGRVKSKTGQISLPKVLFVLTA